MSCSMTIAAVRNQTKTVTRRHVDTWTNLKPGDRLTLIEKGMGLAKGEKQVVLAEVEIIDVYEDVLAGINQIADGEYAEGDEPGGPGLRSYEWVSTEKSGWVRHRRDDGAHALAAKVLTEIHQPQPEGTTP
jgi:hypothetical protein